MQIGTGIAAKGGRCRERCRAVRGSDVAAIVIVDDEELLSVFVGRRCFIINFDFRDAAVHGPLSRIAVIVQC
jgi:hypothetical protein